MRSSSEPAALLIAVPLGCTPQAAPTNPTTTAAKSKVSKRPSDQSTGVVSG